MNNFEKMHETRTERAKSNLRSYEDLYKHFGGAYTESEINMLHDLYPCLRTVINKPEPKLLKSSDLIDLFDQLNAYANQVTGYIKGIFVRG